MADEQLRDAARRLREAEHLAPEHREELAATAEQLADALKAAPPPEAAKLGEAASGLVKAVHERHDPSLLEKARRRLEHAIIAVETEAPVATGVASQLIDALANIGI